MRTTWLWYRLIRSAYRSVSPRLIRRRRSRSSGVLSRTVNDSSAIGGCIPGTANVLVTTLPTLMIAPDSVLSRVNSFARSPSRQFTLNFGKLPATFNVVDFIHRITGLGSHPVTSIVMTVLLPQGFLFGLLLRRQDADQLPSGPDTDDLDCGFERFFFLHFRFNRGQLSLLIPHHRAQFPFADLYIGLGADPGSIRIESDRAQFRDLLIREPKLLLVLQEVPEQMRSHIAMSMSPMT